MRNYRLAFGVIIAVISFGLFGGCATETTNEPVEPYYHGRDQLIFPAVYGMMAFEESFHWQNSYFDEVDLMNNSFIIRDIQGFNLLLPTIATLSIKLQDGFIRFEFYDYYEQRSGIWYSVPRSAYFPRNAIERRAHEHFAFILDNEEHYEQYHSFAHSDLLFLAQGMRRMTEIQRQNYIQQNFTGFQQMYRGRIQNVIENTDFEEENRPTSQYKYRAIITVTRPEELIAKSGSLRSVSVDYFTNDESFTNHSRGTMIEFEGELINMKQSGGNNWFTIYGE
ncbi:hypothetical protein [Spirochaeta dissipatitropha]